MSKEIFLYSEDKKYKCAFELAETTDHFGCPDHSAMVLFEERENGTYIIAQAKDKILETEKDKRISELEEQLKNLEELNVKFIEIGNEFAERNKRLEEQLKNAIVPKFKIGDYFIEYWDKTPNIYQYQGNLHFKCLNKTQGYHCDYVILGALLLEKDFICKISKEEAQAKLKELQGEKK